MSVFDGIAMGLVAHMLILLFFIGFCLILGKILDKVFRVRRGIK